ncbi:MULTISPECIES: hypothetical protein [Streptomyces]|uniref:hypothetical protein n=1 Tax=Streptomyces TaxID=1883 RepID=UPI00163BCC55|nr:MULTISPECIES: hypothetical protein [Streptomyces]MBC2878335.1 hypothetical protein [Streptomyces sp. TYQ1024]UBI40549.1 hypothetical protein K7I03_31550 [Streptomyces mobaraensis]UKW33130.1 hypothetical protein MCU78_31470 [Streptomyces sp. TYQ1024]
MEEWRALVAAEQEVARCRAEVNQLPSRVDLLAKALSSGSAWDRSAALDFLHLFPEDVPKLLGLLIDVSMSTGWVLPACETIRAARQEIDQSQFARVALECLSGGEVDDYLRLADVLVEVEAWEALGAVIGKAAESGDPEIREVSRSFAESHGGKLP